MSPTERRATFALAGVYGLRMLGLFMILPILTLYAEDYSGYSPTLAGLAIGMYGLTQAVLQTPFGWLSDRIGRKPVIVAGLLTFALGSAVAGLSESMLGLILGRALQGSGAIAAAIMALTADLTREDQRTKAMAIIGASIGGAFSLALIIGPALGRWIGLSGVFWLTALLALGAIALLQMLVPKPVTVRFHRDTEPEPREFGRALRDGQLLRLDAGVLLLHLIITASFVVVPLVLRDQAGLPAEHHWKIYLLVLVLSLGLMAPCILYADRSQRFKHVFAAAVLLLGFSQLGLGIIHHSLVNIVTLMIVFFTAFNVLEASLPSLVSRIAPAEIKGTAFGVYSTSQFFGAFLGGLCGGWLYGQHGARAVFGVCAGLAGLWFLLAMTMRGSPLLSSRMINLGAITEEQASQLASQLNAITGVVEAVVVVEDGIAYLKVDHNALDEQALRAFSAATA